ncbi:MAG: lipopolysaccharide biosynthesis protein RfbH [Victivallaceae bacterium]
MNKIDELKNSIMSQIAEYYRLAHRDDGVFDANHSRINYAGRIFDENELLNLTDAALEFWLTAGKWTKQFESGLADFLGIKHVLLVNSGSSANLLAFMALTSPLLGERTIKRGDEVITVAAGFPTTVAPIIQYGAVPVFVDVDLNGNIRPDLLNAALSVKTKAVFAAHTLGNPFALKEVKDFCRHHNLWLIEDNCDALGAQYQNRYTGTFGDVGTSSFYPPHHMTMGEGGAVYTDNPTLKKILLSMRDWGRDCWCETGFDNTCGCRFSGKFGTLPEGYDHKYVYSHFGYNLKATDLQAAIGCAQLEKLPEFIRKRRENFAFLRSSLRDCRDIFILPETTENSEPSWFGFMLTRRDNTPFSRNELAQHLEANRIQTRNLFAGNLTRHPCFESLVEGCDYRIAGTLTNTDKIMNDSLWIGVYPGMSEAKLDYMVKTIKKFIKEIGLKFARA